MTSRSPLFAALAVLALAGCSQGSGSSGSTATPAPTTSSVATAAAPTQAPSAAPSATAAVGSTGKTIAVAEVNASGMGGAFSPALLQIHVGDTVEWTNSSGNIHNVTFAAPSTIRADSRSEQRAATTSS